MFQALLWNTWMDVPFQFTIKKRIYGEYVFRTLLVLMFWSIVEGAVGPYVPWPFTLYALGSPF